MQKTKITGQKGNTPKTQEWKKNCDKMAEIPLILSFAYYSKTGFGEQIQSCSYNALQTVSNPASIRHIKISLQAYPRTKN